MSQTNKRFPKLTVRNKKPGTISVGANTEVLLDGKPMGNISFLKIEIKSKKVAKVTMEMYADVDLELDSIPHIKEKKPEAGPVYELGRYEPTRIAEGGEEDEHKP